MKRLALVALVALIAAPAAVAVLPIYKSSSVGEGLPFKAYASVAPTVNTCGKDAG